MPSNARHPPTAIRSSSAVAVFAFYLLGTLCLPIADFSRYRGLAEPSVPVIGNALAFENPLNRGLVLGGVVLVIAGVGWMWRRTSKSHSLAQRVMESPSLTLRVAMEGHWHAQRVSTKSHWLARRASLRSHWLALRAMGWDALFVLWILTPLLTGFFNPSPIVSDAWQSLYLAVVWGGPYGAARLICRTNEELQGCLWWVLIAGGVSALPALAEMVVGRFVYRDLYGYHPFQEIGQSRWFGYRPLLCFEDPNQVAMWWLTVALAAVIVIPQSIGSPVRMAGKWGALALPFLFQGVGAAILTVVGVGVLNVRKVTHWKVWLGVLFGLAVVLFLARGPLLRSAREVARSTGVEDVVRGLARDSSLQSFGWRLAREEQGSTLWSEHPIFGWGSVMFWNVEEFAQRPWGLVSLVTGGYGLVGTAVFVACFFLPLIMAFTRTSSEGRHDEASCLYVAVPLMVALHGIDATMNPAFFLPVLFVFGAWVAGESMKLEG